MPIIDLNQLPAPDVVEELDFETILAERKATLISLQRIMSSVRRHISGGQLIPLQKARTYRLFWILKMDVVITVHIHLFPAFQEMLQQQLS